MTLPSTNVTAIEGIVDAFSFYVFSGMPAHLIYVPEMRLVDRDEIFNMIIKARNLIQSAQGQGQIRYALSSLA